MDWQKSLHELRTELATHEGYPCVTLTLPTARNMPDNAQDPIRLKNLLTQAENRLNEELGKRPAAKTLENLKLAAESVNHDRNYEGLAIFANETLEIVLKTRFDLPEELIIDDRFALSTLLRAERRAEPYSVLVLSLDEARLYQGQREDLAEIKEGSFPAKNSGAGAGSTVTAGPGVNFTATVDETRRKFVKDCLEKLLEIEGVPHTVVVTGTPEILSNAESQLPQPLEILCTVPGNYINENQADLGSKVWEQVREARRELSAQLVASLDNARSAQKFESGVQSIAPLAKDGRVETLIVAMDYRAAGQVDPETGAITLIDEPETWDDVDDVVDWVVQRVVQNSGTVKYVEAELMPDYPIAAVLRY